MIPEEIIEQAAAAMFSNDSADWGFSPDWMDSADDETREIWRASARAALEAALPRCECGAAKKNHHPITPDGPQCAVSPSVGHRCPCELFVLREDTET